MSETNTGQMYGFDIPNPQEIPGLGRFIDTPTPPMRAITVSEHIGTNAIWDHDSGLTHYWGNQWLDKLSILTLDFHWESVADLKAEDTPIAQEVTVTEGNVTTDTDTTSFTQSIGAEGGGEGKGLSLKVSASLSKTTTQGHSVSISQCTRSGSSAGSPGASRSTSARRSARLRLQTRFFSASSPASSGARFRHTVWLLSVRARALHPARGRSG